MQVGLGKVSTSTITIPGNQVQVSTLNTKSKVSIFILKVPYLLLNPIMQYYWPKV